MKLEFCKMNASGNDFVIVKKSSVKSATNLSQLSLKLADRYFGIGCDQVIFYNYSGSGNNVEVEVYNQDGSEVSMCLNMLRCLMGYFNSSYGLQFCDISILHSKLGHTKVSFSLEGGLVKIKCPPSTIKNDIVNIGNVHKIIYHESEENPDFTSMKPSDEFNYSYVKLTGDRKIEVNTIERGVGYTLACGSAMAASVAYLHYLGKITNSAEVYTKGCNGTSVNFQLINGSWYMLGNYNVNFIGTINI